MISSKNTKVVIIVCLLLFILNIYQFFQMDDLRVKVAVAKQIAIEHAGAEHNLKIALEILVTTNKFSEDILKNEKVIVLDDNSKMLSKEIALLRRLQRITKSGMEDPAKLLSEYKIIEDSLSRLRTNQ